MASTSLAVLFARGLLSRSDSDSESCHVYTEDTTAAPITGSLTFHQILTYISAAAMGVCCAGTFLLIAGHIFNYHQPRIQKQLIRVILMMPVFAIFCFFGVLSYRLTPYFLPIAQLYEAFAIVAVFYLMIAMVSPPCPDMARAARLLLLPENGGRAHFTNTYVCVMQLLPGRIVTTIAVIIISAVDCPGGKHYRRGHTVISIINGIQAVIALLALLRFLRRWLPELKAVDSRIVAKLACFKLIVAVEFIQNIAFRILAQTNALKPSRTRSYDDMSRGISATLLAVEAALIGIAMVWAYWPGLHRRQQQQALVAEAGKIGQQPAIAQSSKLSPLRAVWDSIDLLDVLAGVFRAVKLYGERRRGGRAPTGAVQSPTYQQQQPQYQAYQAPAQRY